MQQIDNFMSRILQEKESIGKLGSVLIISKNSIGSDYKQLAERLNKYFYIDKIYNIDTTPDNVDLIVFDKKCQDIVKNCGKRKPFYIVGKMTADEDYFGLWEQYRNISQGIYIEREDDTGKIEILEWHKGNTDIELSIIIPVYNISNYLCKCIDTLTQWKAPYIEYIFVDDGSTDKSPEIIRQKMQSDNRIQLIQKANGGCASARNKGLQLAKGRYIGFVDGDDFIKTNMYHKLLKRALLGNYDLAYCGYAEYYEGNGRIKPAANDYMGEPYRTGTYRQDKVQLLAVNTKVAIWRCIYKKSILQNQSIAFHEDLMLFDDLPFKIEYIFAAKSAVCVPETLYYYRQGRQEQDTSCSDERLYVHFNIFNHLDKYVKEKKDQRMWDLLQIVKLNTHWYAISAIRSDLKPDYIKKARKELTSAMGYWRCVCLAYLYMGWKGVRWVTKLWISK